MSEEVDIINAAVKPVRWDGAYHTGLYAPQVNLMGKIVRITWKNDYGQGIPEGRLAAFCGCKLTDAHWETAIRFLAQYKYVTLEMGRRQDSTNVCITGLGKDLAMKLCDDRRLAGKTTAAGRPEED